MIADYFDREDKGEDFKIITTKGNEITFTFEDGRYNYYSSATNQTHDTTINGAKEIIMILYQDRQ